MHERQKVSVTKEERASTHAAKQVFKVADHGKEVKWRSSWTGTGYVYFPERRGSVAC
jgi:hypothetical protein